MHHPSMNNTAVFIHIPKTAGTTLHEVIERQYNPKNILSIHTKIENLRETSKFKNSSSLQEQKINIVKGHTFYGWHQLLKYPCSYFTLLRDPVERFISNYFFLLKKKGHPLGQKLVKQKVSLEEFSAWPGEDNYQTRFLAKNVMEDDLNLKQKECNRQMLDLAKKNLAENFAVVGTVEEFDKTLLILKNIFGWKNVHYKVKNKNKQRPKQTLLSPDTLDLIKVKNKLDMELYQYATEILQTLAVEQGSSFENEVSNFQKRNGSSLGQAAAFISSSTSKVTKTIYHN